MINSGMLNAINMTNKLKLLNRPSVKTIIKETKRVIEKQILESFNFSIEPTINKEQEKQGIYEYVIDYCFNNNIFDPEIAKKYPETLLLPFHVCSKIQVSMKDIDAWDKLFKEYHLEEE